MGFVKYSLSKNSIEVVDENSLNKEKSEVLQPNKEPVKEKEIKEKEE